MELGLIVVAKITKKISSFKVLTEEDNLNGVVIVEPKKTILDYERELSLVGSTYKIKTPKCEHALYVTINDAVINKGEEHEEKVPYEVFLNSRNMEHYQWVVALTRTISAVFRKGGDVSFLVEELKGVFDPTGGYFKKGGVFMPSLVAEIGHVIEQHLIDLGSIKVVKDESVVKYIEEKKIEAEKKGALSSASICPKCMSKSLVSLDNCMTCLNCGDSKCG